jgi:hypothetical protein
MKFLAISQRKILGSSLLLPAYGLGGSRATPFLSAALFAKQKTKFGGGDPRSRTLRVRYGARSEGGAGIHFPPTPFSARPARAFRFGFCRAKRGNHSGFCSKKVRTSFSNCDKMTVTCDQCGKKFFRSTKRINESVKFNWKMYCSKLCLGKSKNKQFAKS